MGVARGVGRKAKTKTKGGNVEDAHRRGGFLLRDEGWR